MSTKRHHLYLGTIYIGKFFVSEGGVVLHHKRADGEPTVSLFDSQPAMLAQLKEQHFSIHT